MAIKPAVITSGNTVKLTQITLIGFLEGSRGNKTSGHRLREHSQADKSHGDRPVRCCHSIREHS
jgi:hypothetical protein